MFKGQAEVGVYSLAVRISSVIVFLMVAFRLAWPAFAYSIEDDGDRKANVRVRAHVPAASSAAGSSLVLGLLSPWIVRHPRAEQARVLPRVGGGRRSSRSPATAYAGYTVLAIGIGRARRTQFNWVVTGAAALLNVALNFALIPPYGMMGAAISTIAAYVAMFIGMTLQRAARLAGALPVAPRGDALARGRRAARSSARPWSAPLPLAIALCLVYPVVLLPLALLPAGRAPSPAPQLTCGARLLLAGIVVAVGAAIAAINRVVDPKDEFYSGAALTEALESNCLLADDVVRSRSYPEFKRDLFGRASEDGRLRLEAQRWRRGVDLGFPGFGPETCSTRCRPSRARRRKAEAERLRRDERLLVRLRRAPAATSTRRSPRRSRYLLSPWTFASSLDLMRRSRTLAFTGWEKQRAGRHAASSTAARRLPPGAQTARSRARRARRPPRRRRRASRGTGSRSLDEALAIARARGWRVVGLSG